jgi:uncharacterized Ntn-hydrolase superfamily protein
MEEGSQKQVKKEVFPLNPYRYNPRGSSLQFPSRLPPIDERVQHEEIEESIASLEKVYKVCVETMSEGVDSYWLMSKDLEKRVKYINQRVETPTKVFLEMADDRKLLVKVIKNQHDDITELATHFACIAHACNLKREDTISEASFTQEEE